MVIRCVGTSLLLSKGGLRVIKCCMASQNLWNDLNNLKLILDLSVTTRRELVERKSDVMGMQEVI